MLCSSLPGAHKLAHMKERMSPSCSALSGKRYSPQRNGPRILTSLPSLPGLINNRARPIFLLIFKHIQYFPFLLQEKILAFNKPDVNEEELRAMQRKKASYNAKLAKFELAGEEKKRISSQAKVKAKMFEEMEGQEEREKEAEMRKEEFKKRKQVFKETDETSSQKSEEEEEASTAPPAEGEVSKKKAVFECQEDSQSIDEKSVDGKSEDEMTEALERERRREEFLEKQTLFGK